MVKARGDITQNLHDVRSRIGEAALRAGRDPQDVCLVAVTKTFPEALVLEAWEAGQRHFGENRPEEGASKIPNVQASVAASSPPTMPVWHMIGHVQSRKTNLVVEHFDVVHSVDRLKIARRLNDLAGIAGRRIPVLLECNVSGEAAKYGYAVSGWQQDGAVRDRLRAEIAPVVALPHLDVAGLMTVAPLVDDAEAVRPVFASLRGLRDWLREAFPAAGWRHLSMGMTDDFDVAVEEGATYVRVGRGVFGARA